jgi:ABC-type Fe3+/spermidine/putrescine transport system ATPase subunit
MDLLTLGIGDISWTISTAARGAIGAEVEAVVRPEAIKLSTTGKGLPGKVVSATYLGSKVDYVVRVGDQTLRVVQSDPAAGSRFAEGAVVDVTLPHAGVQVLGNADR